MTTKINMTDEQKDKWMFRAAAYLEVLEHDGEYKVASDSDEDEVKALMAQLRKADGTED